MTDAPDPAGGPSDPGDDAVRVLVIEDDRDSALGLADLLELDGFRVYVAHDAETGLDLARTERPHVVLCDIVLPGARDGYELARLLRETPECADARLVALTGRGRPEDRDRALDSGFDDLVPKPFDPGRLGSRLRGLL